MFTGLSLGIIGINWAMEQNEELERHEFHNKICILARKDRFRLEYPDYIS